MLCVYLYTCIYHQSYYLSVHHWVKCELTSSYSHSHSYLYLLCYDYSSIHMLVCIYIFLVITIPRMKLLLVYYIDELFMTMSSSVQRGFGETLCPSTLVQCSLPSALASSYSPASHRESLVLLPSRFRLIILWLIVYVWYRILSRLVVTLVRLWGSAYSLIVIWYDI